MLNEYRFINTKNEILQEAYFRDDVAAEGYAEFLTRVSRDTVKFYRLCGTVEPSTPTRRAAD